MPFPTGADEYLKKNEIYVSTLLKDGSLCVTTLHGGAVILEHDGKLRQIIDEADGLPDSDVLSAFQDREGALWLGSDQGVSRVEAASPVSIFSRELTSSAIRFQGSVYVASVAGTAAVARLVSDPKTHRTSLLPIRGATQGFSLLIFKDPTGKTPDQLLVSTSEGVMKVEGDTLVPAMPALNGPTEQTYTLPSRERRQNESSSGMAMVLRPCAGTARSGSTRAGCRRPYTKPAQSRKMQTAISGWVAPNNGSCASKWRQPAWEPLRWRHSQPRRACLPATPA